MTPMHARPHLALAAFALLGMACSAADADLEFPSVCLRVGSIAVPGTAALSGTVAVPYTLDLSGVPLLQNSSTRLDELEVLNVTLTPTAGAPDFSGVTAASLVATAVPAGPLEVARLQPPAATPLVLQGTGANAASGLQDRALPLQLRLTGSIPASGWSADVVTCVRGVVHTST